MSILNDIEPYEYQYPAHRGHPSFGLRPYDGIIVRRPSSSPAVVRTFVFKTVEDATEYIRALPPGAAYCAIPYSGYNDFGLCDHLKSLGIPTMVEWDYWPTEEQRAD